MPKGRSTRRHPLSSSDEEVHQEVAPTQSREEGSEVVQERIDIPDDGSQQDDGSPYRPSSPGFEERSATPKSQNKSPSAAASRGSSPDAGLIHLDADAPRDEVPVVSNKLTRLGFRV